VEGIVVKAAWLWGSDSSIINNPRGEPGSTPLYVCLPSTWSSVDGDHMFSPVLWKGSLTWDFEGKVKDVTNLSIGAIWNFGKGTGLL